MEFDIRPLTPGLLEDYLDFFDHRAFCDHPEWAFCYCTYYHLGKEDEKRLEAETAGRWSRDVLRNIAVSMIRSGGLRGYLAYSGGQAVGWCNTADKKNFKKLCEDRKLWEEGDEARVKAVTCFAVDPRFRRQGVATALLERAVTDAVAEGYRFLEAYPAQGELDCFAHYHGHPAMFRKAGFTEHRRLEGYSVFRKEL